jgi:tRNA 2-thiouridine synthesizing protein E
MQTSQLHTSPLSTNDVSLLALFDDDDFMINPELWTKTLAEQLAANAEIGELTTGHWEIIEFVRDRYLRLGAIPPMSRVCREFGHKRDAVRVLFGGCLQLWQIAGLPYPGEEAKTYMD